MLALALLHAVNLHKKWQIDGRSASATRTVGLLAGSTALTLCSFASNIVGAQRVIRAGRRGARVVAAASQRVHASFRGGLASMSARASARSRVPAVSLTASMNSSARDFGSNRGSDTESGVCAPAVRTLPLNTPLQCSREASVRDEGAARPARAQHVQHGPFESKAVTDAMRSGSVERTGLVRVTEASREGGVGGGELPRTGTMEERWQYDGKCGTDTLLEHSEHDAAALDDAWGASVQP